MNNQERFQNGEKVTWAGIAVNVALTFFKAFAGIIGKSTAMVADAGHSVSDIFTDIVTLASLKVSKKPVDREHPYGHGKIEAIASSVLGLILVMAGFAILAAAVMSIWRGAYRVPEMIALIAAVASIVVKEAMYRYTVAVGKRINSPVIVANAWHHRSDALSSVAVLVGVVGARLGYPVLDLVAAGVVSLLIVKVGIEIVIEGYNQLMDKGPDELFINKVIQIAEFVDGVEHCQTRGRRMGQYYLLDVKLDVDPEVSVAKGHDISRVVKKKILNGIDHVADVMVHINPHDEEESPDRENS